jgi:hypothetical protein
VTLLCRARLGESTVNPPPFAATVNPIKGHRRVRAGERVPHEFNYRYHPEQQKRVLAALYAEVGFARSLLAYELPDGRLKLIDGHLRRDFDPAMEVEVEVLDVTDDEARALLLSIDPLAELAASQEQLQARLRELVPAVSPDLKALWEAAAAQALERPAAPGGWGRAAVYGHEFYVLIRCRDEPHQVELLTRFLGEGLDCQAKLC